MKNLKELLMSENPVATLRVMVEQGTLADFNQDIANLKMDIPRGYHHKDNLEHSIRVLENAISMEENGPDLVLRTAALLHDIGKPATRKLGARKSVSFDGHEVVGARIVSKMLPKQGYSKSEVREVALLVRLHMRSHGFDTNAWTDSAVRRLVTDAENEVTLSRLLIVFKADVTTKSDQKRNRVHKVVEHLEETIARFKKDEARKSLRPAYNGHELMEMFGLEQGRELGQLMKFLNSDEGIHLNRDDALAEIKKRFNI